MSLSTLNSVHRNVVKKGLAKPAAPTGLTVVGTPTTSSIAFSYTAPPGPVTSYSLYYSTSNGYSGTLYTTTGSTSGTIAGLTVGTYYYIYVTATNAVGTSPTSSILSTQTAPNPPTSLSGSAASQTSINISWSSITGGNVPVQVYYVYVGTTTNNSMYASTGANSYTITGLTASTTYYINVTTQLMFGYSSDKSTQISVTTQSTFQVGPYGAGTPGNIVPNISSYSWTVGSQFSIISASGSGTSFIITFTSSYPYATVMNDQNYPIYPMLNGWGANGNNPFSVGWVTNNGNGTYTSSFNFPGYCYNPSGAGTNCIWLTWTTGGVSYSQNSSFKF